MRSRHHAISSVARNLAGLGQAHSLAIIPQRLETGRKSLQKQ